MSEVELVAAKLKALWQKPGARLLDDRPLLSCVVEARDRVPPGKRLCGRTWLLQECER